MRIHVHYAYSRRYTNFPSLLSTHMHPVYELVYYIEGLGYLCSDEKRYAYGPDMIILTGPNVAHQEVYSTPTIELCVGFESLDDDFTLGQEIKIFSNEVVKSLCPYVQMMLEEMEKQQKFHQETCDSLLTIILVCLQRLMSNELPSRMPELPNHPYDFFDRKSDADIIELWNIYMKDYTGYSHDSFRRAFKKRTGTSPTQFLQYLRLQKACFLLNSTTMSITDITIACGFSSCSYFTQQFKKKIGVTPSDFRVRREPTQASMMMWRQIMGNLSVEQHIPSDET